MTLGELITFLQEYDPDHPVAMGFSAPHSYRGFYECLAFEPTPNVTVGSMLACAREALGQTFEGYKGGEYVMETWSDVYIAEYGCTGEEIGPILLGYMINKYESGEKIMDRASYDEDVARSKKLYNDLYMRYGQQEGWSYNDMVVVLAMTLGYMVHTASEDVKQSTLTMVEFMSQQEWSTLW